MADNRDIKFIKELNLLLEKPSLFNNGDKIKKLYAEYEHVEQKSDNIYKEKIKELESLSHEQYLELINSYIIKLPKMILEVTISNLTEELKNIKIPRVSNKEYVDFATMLYFCINMDHVKIVESYNTIKTMIVKRQNTTKYNEISKIYFTNFKSHFAMFREYILKCGYMPILIDRIIKEQYIKHIFELESLYNYLIINKIDDALIYYISTLSYKH